MKDWNGWYDKFELFEYDVIIENERTNIRRLIKECEEYFKKDNVYLCFLTQGDPNTLNIGVKPIFFDYNTSGYNSYIAEFATFMWSTLIADIYFCTKYHRNSYKNHEDIYYHNKKYTPNIMYKVNSREKIINIEGKAKTSKTRVYIIVEYLKMLKRKGLKITDEIIYFFIMRILCVFDLKQMEEIDQIYCLYFIHIVYKMKQSNKTNEEYLKDIMMNKMDLLWL